MIRQTSLILTFADFLGSADAAEPKFDQPGHRSDNIAIGYGLAIGDVDGDKKPDILLADKSKIAWYRNGDWKRFDDRREPQPDPSARATVDNVCIAARDHRRRRQGRDRRRWPVEPRRDHLIRHEVRQRPLPGATGGSRQAEVEADQAAPRADRPPHALVSHDRRERIQTARCCRCTGVGNKNSEGDPA